MTDYKALKDAIDAVSVPIEMKGQMATDKTLWDEYAHTPYIDERVREPQYPENESENE